MNLHGERAPRGQWMATDGRELYHNWLVSLIEQHNTNASDNYDGLQPNDNTREPVILDRLAHFARDFSDKFLETNQAQGAESTSVLIDSADQIKYYTSADDMLGESSNWHRAIKEHTRDGIKFACRVSLGLAYDAYQSTGQSSESVADFYDSISAIMHNPSFHKVLETFSTTGFGVLGNKVQKAMLSEDMSFVVSNILGLGVSPVARIVHVVRNEDGTRSYQLNPRIMKKLYEKLREQNKTHTINRLGSHALRQRLTDRSFTTGCPVRRAPARELAKGNEKSGIALLAEHMGDELTRAARVRRPLSLSQAQL